MIKDSFQAMGIAEGFIEVDSEGEIIEAWQYLIDTGIAWELQGLFGRTASRLIERGICSKALHNSGLTPKGGKDGFQQI